MLTTFLPAPWAKKTLWKSATKACLGNDKTNANLFIQKDLHGTLPEEMDKKGELLAVREALIVWRNLAGVAMFTH